MNASDQFDPDGLHRLLKHAIDAGTVGSIEEAAELFAGYRVLVDFAPPDERDPVHQASLLTTVALASRVFLGGVSVRGPLHAPLLLDLPLEGNLQEAVVSLGGSIGAPLGHLPTIVIGGSAQAKRDGFCVRTAVGGWRGGIVPIHADVQPETGPAMVLSGMLAAALAVNEAYLHVQNPTSAAGRRAIGLSLWRPEPSADWLIADAGEPTLSYLPSRLWLIGLGHLGQAYLWALGLLPYVDPTQVKLVLQDTDVITPSTPSTSVLTSATMVGLRKTRQMASWCEARGFVASIQERKFSDDFKRQTDEPAIALCGMDNASGRRALDNVGFDLVIEAGLGHGWHNFRKMRVHVLPGSRSAAAIWRPDAADVRAFVKRPYQDLLSRGKLDQCGITLLAGKAVGAPFVGATAAVLAISELLRLLHGGQVTQLIDLDMQDPDGRTVLVNAKDFSTLNPGFAPASSALDAHSPQRPQELEI